MILTLPALEVRKWLLLWNIWIPCGRKFLRVLIFAVFAIFPAFRKIKTTARKFSRKYLLQSEYSQEPMTHRLLIMIFANLNSPHKYSTKKWCLFNHNLSLSFRNKTVYNEILVYSWKNVILLHVLNKNENIINAGRWVVSKNGKN